MLVVLEGISKFFKLLFVKSKFTEGVGWTIYIKGLLVFEKTILYLPAVL